MITAKHGVAWTCDRMYTSSISRQVKGRSFTWIFTVLRIQIKVGLHGRLMGFEGFPEEVGLGGGGVLFSFAF